MNGTFRVLITVFFAVIVLVIAHDGRSGPSASLYATAGADLRAFYCAGAAVVAGSDPYALEPLRTCEHRVQPQTGWLARIVDPSPLPSYDLALFALLARLPYEVVKPFFLLMLVAMILVATWYISKLVELPTLVVFGMLGLGAGYVPLVYGQLTPIVLAALCAAAYFAERRSYRSLAFALGIAMIEPHIGVVAAIGSFIWLPPTRRPIVLIGLTLAVVGLVTAGVGGNVAYVTRVLPDQSWAEIVAIDQFSLSHLLHVAGASDSTALRLGAASYVVATVVGLLAAKWAADATHSTSLIVTVPPAAILFGGSYIHELQFVAAFPAAFVLANRAPRARPLALLALLLLAFPWFSLSDVRATLLVPAFVLVVVTVATLIYFSMREFSIRRRVVIASGAVFGCIALVSVFRHVPVPHVPVPQTASSAKVGVYSVDASASRSWGAFLRANPQVSVPSWHKEIEKIPTWLAIVLIVSVACAQRRVALPIGIRYASVRSNGRNVGSQAATHVAHDSRAVVMRVYVIASRCRERLSRGRVVP